MQENFESRRIQAKIQTLQETLSSSELRVFLDLKNRCVQRGDDFFLDKKYFPFPDEVEDLLAFLQEEKLLMRLGKSDNGVGGYLWKLVPQEFNAVRSAMVPAQEEVETVVEKSADEIFFDAILENLDYDELNYLLRLADLWEVEGNTVRLDVRKRLEGESLHTSEKKKVFEGLVNSRVAVRSAHPDVILIDREKYFALWNKILTTEVATHKRTVEEFEHTEAVLFQLVHCFFEQYCKKFQKTKISKDQCIELIKNHASTTLGWKTSNINIFETAINLLIQRQIFYNEPGAEETLELAPAGYRYIGKEVPSEVQERFDRIFVPPVEVPEEALLEPAEEELPVSETKEVDRRNFLRDVWFDIDDRALSVEGGVTPEKRKGGRPRKIVSTENSSSRKAHRAREFAPEFVREFAPVAEQHAHALERMKNFQEKADSRKLYAHQVPMIEDFLVYLDDVVQSRKQVVDEDALATDSAPEKKVDMTRARIVAAPRTGKTTVAAEIIRRTGLRTVFFVPAINLVAQAKKELQGLLPHLNVAMYSGTKGFSEDISQADVIVAIYHKAVADFKHQGKLPEEIKTAPLIFADEGHEAMSEYRTQVLDDLDPDSLKIALSGTPDYNEERALENFFPYLIHELPIREAIEMGLLAPFKYASYEVGVDASRVDLDGADYDEAQIGEIMSKSEVFKFCAAIRYSTACKDIPTLISCKTKKQAEKLQIFLQSLRGEDSEGVGLVLDKVKDRETILRNFEEGKMNTLITVRALLRGWDSARCKLLIDIAPGISPVTAGQKYTRPLTKSGDVQAKIFALFPANLPRPPILPSDILMSYEVDVSDVRVGTGYVPRKPKNDEPPPETDESLPSNIDGISVRLVVKAKEHGSLGMMEFDKRDDNLLRQVIETGIPSDQTDNRSFELKRLEILRSYQSFRKTQFKHRAFQGYGKTLLFLCGVRGYEDYWKFVMKLYPEDAGTLLIASGRYDKRIDKDYDRQHQSVRVDAERILEVAKSMFDREEAATMLRTFMGYAEPAEEKDILLINRLQRALEALPERLQKILYLYYVEEKTFGEIGEMFDLTGSRAQQILRDALKSIRQTIVEQARVKKGSEKEPKALVKKEETRFTKEKKLKEFLVQMVLVRYAADHESTHRELEVLIQNFLRELSSEEVDELYNRHFYNKVDFTVSQKGSQLFEQKIREFYQRKDQERIRKQSETAVKSILRPYFIDSIKYDIYGLSWYSQNFGEKRLDDLIQSVLETLTYHEILQVQISMGLVERMTGAVYNWRNIKEYIEPKIWGKVESCIIDFLNKIQRRSLS